MEDPQVTIFKSLQHNVEKAFALVVNDIPVRDKDGNQVFVKLVENRINFYTRKKVKGTDTYRLDPFDTLGIWRNMKESTNYCGVNFGDLYTSNDACTVVLNDSFRVMFINSPLNVFVKKIISWLGTSGLPITRIQLPSYENLTQSVINHWSDIISTFQAESIMKYIASYENLFKHLVKNKLRRDENKLFRNRIGDRVNMIHLFFQTAGMWNPFLEDKTLTQYAPKKNWIFSADDDNHRLFVRECKGFTLHCMTPVSFCRSLGLTHKLEFDNETALLMLAGLLYRGNLSIISFPTTNTIGYLTLVLDPENGSILDHHFTENPLPDKKLTGFESVKKISSLEYFCLARSRYLTNDALSRGELLNILSKANLVNRSE